LFFPISAHIMAISTIHSFKFAGISHHHRTPNPLVSRLIFLHSLTARSLLYRRPENPNNPNKLENVPKPNQNEPKPTHSLHYPSPFSIASSSIPLLLDYLASSAYYRILHLTLRQAPLSTSTTFALLVPSPLRGACSTSG
jgi:hypothetical protein